jgi:hypothetical protein
LLDRLENNELDDYSDIATLIGIEFDENTVWGQLTVLELKLLIHLALEQLETQDLRKPSCNTTTTASNAACFIRR